MSHVRLHAIGVERRQAHLNIESIRAIIANNEALAAAHEADRDELKLHHADASRRWAAAMRSDSGRGFGFEVGVVDYSRGWDSPVMPVAARASWHECVALSEQIRSLDVTISNLRTWNDGTGGWRQRLEANERVLNALDEEEAELKAEMNRPSLSSEPAALRARLLAKVGMA